MVEGTTQSGFKFKYDGKITDSMRFVEAFVDTERGGFQSLMGLVDLMNMLLGAEQKEQLFKFLEKKTGTASMEDVKAALIDMINAKGEAGKN